MTFTIIQGGTSNISSKKKLSPAEKLEKVKMMKILV